MDRKNSQSSPRRFCLEGQFLGFAPGRKSPFKYLQLATPQGLVTIKLSKSLRLMMFRYLTPGDEVRIVGRQKTDKHTGELCFKGDEVLKLTSAGELSAAVQPLTPVSQPQNAGTPKRSTKAKVLVCQKSGCRKRGGQAVCKSLETAISQHGLTDQVKVISTGCMDRCKAGPNVVFMPNKARYSRVSPTAIADLVQQHYSDLAESVHQD